MSPWGVLVLKPSADGNMSLGKAIRKARPELTEKQVQAEIKRAEAAAKKAEAEANKKNRQTHDLIRRATWHRIDVARKSDPIGTARKSVTGDTGIDDL